MKGDLVDLDPDDEHEQEPQYSRRDILEPLIQSTVAALGGLATDSDGRAYYDMGDSCLGCLKDLKKFWRKDDTDDERTVARIFWDCRVLEKDLVNILLETAGKGAVEDKRGIACGEPFANAPNGRTLTTYFSGSYYGYDMADRLGGRAARTRRRAGCWHRLYDPHARPTFV